MRQRTRSIVVTAGIGLALVWIGCGVAAAQTSEGLILPPADPHSTFRHLVAPPEEGRWYGAITHGLIGAYLVGSAVDLGVTQYSMGHGGFREANPLLRWAEDRPVAMGIAKQSAAVGLAALLLAKHRQLPKPVMVATLVAINAGQWYVVARNRDRLGGR